VGKGFCASVEERERSEAAKPKKPPATRTREARRENEDTLLKQRREKREKTQRKCREKERAIWKKPKSEGQRPVLAKKLLSGRTGIHSGSKGT